MLSGSLAARTFLYAWYGCSYTMEVLMTYPKLHIVNGPAQRDLEQAFLARNLGARARFIILVEDGHRMEVHLQIFNFSFVTCQGLNYKLGGKLPELRLDRKKFLPPFNWIFVEYNAEERSGQIEFSNAG